MRISGVTPIEIVERIEPLLPFWEGSGGMTRVVTVDEPSGIGFTILAGGSGQLMLQTKTSLHDDLPAIAALDPTLLLYVNVDSIDELEAALEGAEVLVPRRTTFYGAQEVWIRDATGAIIGYAEDRADAGEPPAA